MRHRDDEQINIIFESRMEKEGKSGRRALDGAGLGE